MSNTFFITIDKDDANAILNQYHTKNYYNQELFQAAQMVLDSADNDMFFKFSHSQQLFNWINSFIKEQSSTDPFFQDLLSILKEKGY